MNIKILYILVLVSFITLCKVLYRVVVATDLPVQAALTE